jgi:hypothetical protein
VESTLASEPDLVRRQSVLELLVVRHVAEMARNKEDALFVADGFSKHVRQLIEQSYAASVPWPAEERS